MKVALVGPELEENLALRYLHAALVKGGHEALIFEFNAAVHTESVARQIHAYGPAIVGLSMVFTGRAREFAGLAERLRELGYPGHVTAGGHFAAFHAERLLSDVPAIDSVVQGEGEGALVELADRLGHPDTVPGLTYRNALGAVVHTCPRAPCDDLDALVWPTRTPPFHRYLGIPIANVLGSRGCFGRCNFCSISAWHRKTGGRRFRQRHPQQVAREMAGLYHQHGVRIFNFHDDNFFLPRPADSLARFAELRSALDAEGVGRIAVQVKARPDSITPEVVLSLKELGLFRVFLGVESNAVAGLRTLGRGIRREQNHEALRILDDAGIHTAFNLLMFDPETTLADLEDNLEFLHTYRRFPLNFGRVEAYAGTPLEARLRSEGRLKGDYWGHSYAIRDARVESAFQVFKTVFTPRNFEDGAVNLLAMKVDYLLHLLKHFRPETATDGLAEESRRAIEELNGHSVRLLRTILRQVSGAQPPDQRQQVALAETLGEARREFDALARRRMVAVVRRIEERGRTGRPRAFPVRAAAAAAAAVVISASGCRDADKDRHMCEMIMEPIEEPQKPAPPPAPKDDKEMPETEKSPKRLPDDWHMCEMMMRPMEPKADPGGDKADQ